MRRTLQRIAQGCLLIPLLASLGCVRRYAIGEIRSQPAAAFVTRADTGAVVGETPAITSSIEHSFFVFSRKNHAITLVFEKSGYAPTKKTVIIGSREWGRTPQAPNVLPFRVAAVLQANCPAIAPQTNQAQPIPHN